ncbi:MAG: PA2779 family protein [Elusimicrobia bacterium]|nr:PA2779 family protein [Elusimicrobiota bacterium]
MRKARGMHFVRSIAGAMAVLMAASAVGTPRLQAMVAPTEIAVPGITDRSADLKTVQTTLEQKEIRERLAQMGLDDNQIQQRLSRLDDRQLHQIAMRIDQQRAAGDAGGIVITVLLILILAVLLSKLIDKL